MNDFLPNGLSTDTLSIEMDLIIEQIKILQEEVNDTLLKATIQKERMELKLEQYCFGE
jgi:hypothetical protein